jgi:medium-chain acyl-[acyl-carrier-protein] hydrolase
MKTLQSSSSGSEVRDSNVLWFESLSSREKCSLTLFCFPYAGGSSQIYRNWQGYVRPDISVCLIHLPGRGKRINERPFTKLNTLVEALADAIADQLQRPFAFFGHSMGALICFELAREIRRRHGRTPSQVFASGRRAPQLPSTEPPSYDRSDEEFIAALKRLNGTPPALLDQIETRNLFMPVLRADFEIVDTYSYVPDDPLPCPISVYGGLQDHRIPVPDLRAWEIQTSANCTVRMCVGDHFFINNPGRDFFSVLRRELLAARR